MKKYKTIILLVILGLFYITKVTGQNLGFVEKQPVFYLDKQLLHLDNDTIISLKKCEQGYNPLYIDNNIVIYSLRKDGKNFIVYEYRNKEAKEFFEVNKGVEKAIPDQFYKNIYFTDFDFKDIKKVNLESKEITKVCDGILRSISGNKLFFTFGYEKYGFEDCTTLYKYEIGNKESKDTVLKGAWDDTFIISPNENYVICDLCTNESMKKVLYFSGKDLYYELPEIKDLSWYSFSYDSKSIIIISRRNKKVIDQIEISCISECDKAKR